MKLVEVIYNTYEIDDDTLLEYIDYCDKEDVQPDFNDFINWFNEQYFFSDFLEEDDFEFESVNGSFQTKNEFEKVIKRLRFQKCVEKIKEKNDGKV